jgi:hypothetical protein
MHPQGGARKLLDSVKASARQLLIFGQKKSFPKVLAVSVYSTSKISVQGSALYWATLSSLRCHLMLRAHSPMGLHSRLFPPCCCWLGGGAQLRHLRQVANVIAPPTEECMAVLYIKAQVVSLAWLKALPRGSVILFDV